MPKNPNEIKSKTKRHQVKVQNKVLKNREKHKLRRERKRIAAETGKPYVPEQMPVTIDEKRIAELDFVDKTDPIVQTEEQFDEFSGMFRGDRTAKVLITLKQDASAKIRPFIRDFMFMFPHGEFIERETKTVEELQNYAIENDFTGILIFNDKDHEIVGLMHIHLPYGPTAYYRMSSCVCRKNIRNCGKPLTFPPEISVKNFSTRLGVRVGRMLRTLFPNAERRDARQIVMVKNQRDYMFFRFHRYIFNTKEDVRIQELGPQFTLKLRWISDGLFTPFKVYEWKYRKDNYTDRKRFFL
ncbi:hypothetical protein PCE1_003200 [Barthelona sp. PCE]